MPSSLKIRPILEREKNIDICWTYFKRKGCRFIVENMDRFFMLSIQNGILFLLDLEICSIFIKRMF